MFINENYRGKKYSSKALMLLHDFLDLLRVDYTVLYIRSKMTYAGNLYIKSGYQFTANTITKIKDLALLKNIEENNAVQAFLQDSTQELHDGVATMIRHGGMYE